MHVFTHTFDYIALGIGKVIERMRTTESTTLDVKRDTDGKMRVASLLWEAPKVISRGELVKVRNVDCPLHVAEARHHDD
jgi:hypothetical protein